MYSWFAFVMALVFMIIVGWLWREGLWSNVVTLYNVVTAAIIATNYWEPLAGQIDEYMPRATFLADFLSLWLIFVVCFSIFRTVTDRISKVRVRFKLPVEYVGGVVSSILVACVMVSFITMTLHTAPLAINGLGGAFTFDPKAKTVLMFAPDRNWLGFATKLSKEGGPLATSSPNKFDPNGTFRVKYAVRRAVYSATGNSLLIDAK